MHTASRNIIKCADSLFGDKELKDRFLDELARQSSSEKALIWIGNHAVPTPFPILPPVEWQPDFIDRVPEHAYPGRHPLHEQGHYYCLDMASIFSAMVVTKCVSAVSILDMCASPGGKGIFAWRALAPTLMVFNEVIGKRHAALISNLERLHLKQCWVTRLDSAKFAELAPAAFDLVICDVPCSGQSLMARGKPSPGAFHPATINMNTNRQKRILSNSAKAVSPGGYLAYMTCTYSRAENEGVIEWFLKRNPNFSAVQVSQLEAHRSHLSEHFCYRAWPWQGIGAGAFTALLRSYSEGSKTNAIEVEELRPIWPRRE